MSSADTSRPVRGNHLLSLLPDDAYAALAPMLKATELAVKHVVHERDKPFTDVYFPISATISAILPLLDGAALEVGTVGNERVSATEMLAGADAPINNFMCQIAGKAVRIAVQEFRQALDTVPGLRRLCFCYLQCYMAQMAQSAACNSQHAVEARFARWMLVTHDRVEGDDFRLTQELMARCWACIVPA
jgi:hypothetical protein